MSCLLRFVRLLFYLPFPKPGSHIFSKRPHNLPGYRSTHDPTRVDLINISTPRDVYVMLSYLLLNIRYRGCQYLTSQLIGPHTTIPSRRIDCEPLTQSHEHHVRPSQKYENTSPPGTLSAFACRPSAHTSDRTVIRDVAQCSGTYGINPPFEQDSAIGRLVRDISTLLVILSASCPKSMSTPKVWERIFQPLTPSNPQNIVPISRNINKVKSTPPCRSTQIHVQIRDPAAAFTASWH